MQIETQSLICKFVYNGLALDLFTGDLVKGIKWWETTFCGEKFR